MLATINRVTVENAPAGKKYQIATIDYTNDKGAKQYKLFSFKNPQLFKDVQSFQGEQVEVSLTQNGQYWDWTGIKRTDVRPVDAGNGSSGTTSRPATASYGRDFESSAERAKKQVYIVRQSSVSSAVAALSVGSKSPIPVEVVIDYAKQLEQYVLNDGLETLNESANGQEGVLPK